MVREFIVSDLGRLKEVHSENGLPSQCFPSIEDPLVVVKEVVEHEGKPVMAGFLALTAEAYLVVDHTQGTPEQRWQWLQELTERVKQKAWTKGLNDITVWLPPQLEDSFSKRLEQLGFRTAGWKSYTLILSG